MHEDPARSIDGGGCVDYRILGPLEVEVDGIEVDLGPRKQKSLFALLLINHGHTVSTDRILDALWGGDAAGKENALWVYISRLRSALGEVVSDSVLLTRDHGYEIRLDEGQLDADRFERLAEDGMALRESDPASAADTLRAALSLWRGQALEEFTYDEFARDEIRRLESLRNTCLDARIEADLACGRGGELLGELEHMVESRPLDEGPVRHLMMALYRSGRQAEALRVFERFRRTLGEETGTDPSPELRRLEEQILFHDTRLARTVDGDRVPSGSGPNPYKGLEAFGEDDAHLFFGRDALTAEILKRIDEHAIVTVVGPSGCGKSSVVRSGVIPAVRKGALPNSDRWHIATMIPGRHPFIELETALLRSTLDAPSSLRQQFDGSPDELLRAGLRVLPSDDTCLVVVIDQFEELFTLADDTTTRRFLDAVVEASLDDRRRIRFVITLRADFYDRPLAHARFGSAMGAGIVNVVPMAPEELEQAASGPAMRAGVRLEPGLEAALIGDVLGEPGALPLFEFALTDLFDRRVGDTLTLEAYRTMGGIDGAVSRKAEHLYAGLTPDQQAATEQVFLRLVSLSDGETRSRRRVDAAELLSLDLDITDLQAVLDTFGSQRLILFDRNDATGSPTVEVSHEALLEHWDRLAGWIASATEDLVTNARLTALAAEWHDHGEDSAYLLSEGRFTDYSTWAEGSTMTLAAPERTYLQASRQAHEDRARAEADRASREAATARRAKRNAWGLAAVVCLVALVGGILAWEATRPAGPSIVMIDAGEEDAIAAMSRTGFNRAAHDFDIVARYEAVPANMPERVRELAEEGTDLIILGQNWGDLAEQISKEFEDTRFVILDTLGQGSKTITAVTFDDRAGSYVMGVAAARTTQTDTVGIVVGVQTAFMSQFAAGFEAGVHSIDPRIDVLIDFVSSDVVAVSDRITAWQGWWRADLAHEAATQMYERGADVVFTAAGGAGEGVVQAATDFSNRTGENVWAIGVDVDEGFLADDAHEAHVLTSLIKRFDLGVYQAIEAFVEDSMAPSMQLGFSHDAIDYSRHGGYIDPIAAELDAVVAALEAGSIGLRWSPATLPAWRGPAHGSAVLTFDGSSCRFTVEPPDMHHGEILGIVIINATDEVANFGVALSQATGSTEAVGGDGDDGDGATNEGDTTPLFTPTFSWRLDPRGRYELRSGLYGEPLGAFGVGCWPRDDFDSFIPSQVYELVPG